MKSSFKKDRKTESSFKLTSTINKPKIYIAGKVTGEPYQECREKFAMAEFRLRRKGYETINPLRLAPQDANWQDAMKKCVRELAICDEIFMLKDWKNSRGAKVEHYIAEQLGLKFHYEGDSNAVSSSN